MPITFSIVVPVYNRADIIERCILSVLNQTIQNFEIIIVNDGSSDSTAEKLNELSALDCRIKVIHQTNQGPLLARQKGVSVSDGEYILFLDSDDFYDKNLLEKINEYSEQRYDVILFRWRYLNSDLSIYGDSKPVFINETIFTIANKKELYSKLLCTHDLNSLCVKAIKRSLFTSQMFDANKFQGIKNGEDLLQVIPLLTSAENIIYLDIPLYNYVKNNEGTTSNFSDSYFTSRKLLTLSLKQYIRIWDMDSKEYHDIIDRRFLTDVAIGIPKHTQIRKVGKVIAGKYLENIASDEMFRSIYRTYGIKKLRFVYGIQVFSIYHRYFNFIIFSVWIEKCISDLKFILKIL